MTEKLKQTIKEELVKLPKDLQEAIKAFDWINASEELGKKYSLTEEQITAFQAETSLVLIGIEDNYSYALNIKRNVDIDEERSEKMANEAFEKIFNPISNILEENIKKNLSTKKPKLEQDMNFILSGGDYSAFLDKGDTHNHSNTNDTQISGYTRDAKPKVMDMKNKFLYDNEKNV